MSAPPVCPPGQHIETICQDICVPDPVPVWEDLGVVPAIAASPTAIGRAIVQVHPHVTGVYLGYGEWNNTSQPGCDVIRWTGTAYETVTHVATDALWSYRTVNGECWALVTDPEVGADPDAVIIAADGTMRTIYDYLSPYPWHLFDVMRHAGVTYIAGAERVGSASYATVWTERPRQPDNKLKWQPLFQKTNASRAYAVFALNETVYTIDSSGRVYRVADGVQVGTTTNLPSKPMAHGGGIVYRAGWPAYAPGSLMLFNGTTATTIATVSDHFVEGATLWTLENGGIYQGGASYCPAPDQACSLAVDGDWLYVGTRDSHLWRRALA